MTSPNPGSLAHPKYRPDIDGLRAVAILSVVAFHAFPDWVPGGFIGVDIFFVISGFLISGIIFKGLKDGNFSFAEFYSRRIRRIFPALIVVLVAVFAFGWFVLLASEYKALGQHIAGGAGFVSNFVLLKENGYFDDLALSKPLFHLWSLGIEEQFYIVWPLLMWAAYRRKFSVLALILAIGGVSFLWCIMPVLNIYPTQFDVPKHSLWWFLTRIDSVAVFYLPQARFWELLVGAFLAHLTLYPKNIFKANSEALCNIRSFAGTALIALGLLFITKTSEFPGFWALLPTLGTMFVISAGAQSWLNKIVFSNRLLVGVGTISYSLYLWHWPLLIFARIVNDGAVTLGMRIACVCASFVLSWATYRWIEKPLRFGRHLSEKRTVLICLMAFIGCVGFYTYASGGLQFRDFAQRTKPLADAVTDWKYPGELMPRHIDGVDLPPGADLYVNMEQPPKILFLGDSHMQQYVHRLSATATKKAIPVMFFTGPGCPDMPNVVSVYHPYCLSLLDNFRKILEKTPTIKTIVIGFCTNGPPIAGHEYYYQKGNIKEWLDDKQGMRLAVASFKEFLQSLSKKYTVYVILDNPTMDAFDPKLMIKNRLTFTNLASIPRVVPILPEQAELTKELSKDGLAAGVKIVDPLPTLCPQGICRRFYGNFLPIYRDIGHLTDGFVTQEGDYLDEVFSPAKRTPAE